eukprot:scaffold4635_cov267-Pinguiococcus_pyrenoidosus.AAC.14
MTREQVALKFIDLHTMTQRKRDQLQREISAMKTLSHENIVELKHVNLDARYPLVSGGEAPAALLVLEYASGGELFDFMMHTGPFSEEVARTYFRQLTSALNLCHESGIYHRDIKPENLLMSGRFQLKLADFGLSAIQEEDDVGLVTECGTRAYMAPEVMASSTYHGSPADLWSAGVVLFIMLCGNPPLQVANDTDWWFRKLRDGNYRAFWNAHERNPAVQFSPQAKKFLESIFVADPEKRATIEEIIDHPWYCGQGVDEVALEADMRVRKEQIEQRRNAAAQNAARNRTVEDVVAKTTRRAAGDSSHDIPILPDADELVRSGLNIYSTFTTVEEPDNVMRRLFETMADMGAEEVRRVDAESAFQDAGEAPSPYSWTFCFKNVKDHIDSLARAPMPAAADADFGDDPPPPAAPTFASDVQEDVIVEVKLFRLRNSSDCLVGAVRRARGGLFPFQLLFQEMVSKLDDVVVNPDSPVAEPELEEGCM